jgi:hypothetical protein
VGSDPAGGYLALPVDDDSPAHAALFELALDDLEPTGWGPLGETLYLDDIAMFMHQRDFRPDLAGAQGLQVYTVAFGRDLFGLELLAKTADAGGGLFLLPEDVGLLASEIIAASGQPQVPVPALAGPGHLALALRVRPR